MKGEGEGRGKKSQKGLHLLYTPARVYSITKLPYDSLP